MGVCYYRHFLPFSATATPCLRKMTQGGRDAMLRLVLPFALGSALTQSNENPAKELCVELIRAGAAATPPNPTRWSEAERKADANRFPSFAAAIERLEIAQTVAAGQKTETAPRGKKQGSMRL